jgi:hypothetical protein
LGGDSDARDLAAAGRELNPVLPGATPGFPIAKWFFRGLAWIGIGLVYAFMYAHFNREYCLALVFSAQAAAAITVRLTFRMKWSDVIPYVGVLVGTCVMLYDYSGNDERFVSAFVTSKRTEEWGKWFRFPNELVDPEERIVRHARLRIEGDFNEALVSKRIYDSCALGDTLRIRLSTGRLGMKTYVINDDRFKNILAGVKESKRTMDRLIDSLNRKAAQDAARR